MLAEEAKGLQYKHCGQQGRRYVENVISSGPTRNEPKRVNQLNTFRHSVTREPYQ